MLGQKLFTILLLLGLVAAPFIAIALGVFRPRNVSGPDRITPPATGPQLAAVMVIGFIIWFGAQAFYGAYLQIQFAQAHGAQARITEKDFTPVDWAVLSTAPAVLAFGVLLIGDFTVAGQGLLKSLGVTIGQLPRGVGWGIVGAVIVLPVSFFIAGVTTWTYDRVHLHHPQAHELLLQMTSSNGWIRADLIIAATVIAPLFEELFFRGHLQTLIRRALQTNRRRAPLPPLLPIAHAIPQPAADLTSGASVQPAALNDPPVIQYAAPPAPPPGVWQTWLAVLIASMLFTAVHPMWMWPPLFVLAVGLGYAYERTGNLWTTITMHCAFNSLSTTAYLLWGK